MTARSYHHGDLRAALLAQADEMLRVSGVDALRLRDLASAVGVSHGAPRRHFDDKAALLEALAADGWHRMGAALDDAAGSDDRPFLARLNDAALAYIRFATGNPALLDLMASSKHLANASEEVRRARDASFTPVAHIVAIGQSKGEVAAGDIGRIGTVLFATLQGIATMANNNMIDPLEDELISYAVETMMKGFAPQ